MKVFPFNLSISFLRGKIKPFPFISQSRVKNDSGIHRVDNCAHSTWPLWMSFLCGTGEAKIDAYHLTNLRTSEGILKYKYVKAPYIVQRTGKSCLGYGTQRRFQSPEVWTRPFLNIKWKAGAKGLKQRVWGKAQFCWGRVVSAAVESKILQTQVSSRTRTESSS